MTLLQIIYLVLVKKQEIINFINGKFNLYQLILIHEIV